MKRILPLLLAVMLLAGCAPAKPQAQITATTLPVYELTYRLCEGTDLQVTRLITDSVSCLHDYSLNVSQVRAVEAAELVVLSGGGLEDFMSDLLADKQVIDSSQGISLPECEEAHDPAHEHHHHGQDAHFWLSPMAAKTMAENICAGLSEKYPDHKQIFHKNLATLLAELDALQAYGEAQLAELKCRELITFHDGFAYLAHSFGLTVLEAVEEESGSEASAAELKHLIQQVQGHQLPAIFTEVNGSVSAAGIISAETGARVFCLDMCMAGSSYIQGMYRNIDTLKEALG